ncbi:MAG: SUMF1/EgtB/PvdO family nonheme iron enzyme [Pirellulales bacterium]|nr:SUMF1/EgtB/PvdO family nonheme iron enzyme [Pirellulales bacterium]
MKITTILTIFLLAFCCATTAHGVTFDWVTVGNPGNAGDTKVMGDGTSGHGSVSYTYRISKYEVTTSQYVEFLNAVAASDLKGLYRPSMSSDIFGCKIEQTGSDGSYSYSVAADRAKRPVNFVSFFDAMRFVNWLENGQPTGAQGPGTTEDGVYTISDGVSEVRNPNATYFIPSEDEWYKAAYHKNDGVTGNYWDYPTQSDWPNKPSNDLIDPDPGNNANFYEYYDNSYTIGGPYWMTEVGEFENSESPYGTYDQGGNVWEWNEAIMGGMFRGMRGGSFRYSSVSTYLDASNRIHYNPRFEINSFGFRVARSIPEPASFILLACMAIPVMILRRG